jgi:hypothetical protein
MSSTFPFFARGPFVKPQNPVRTAYQGVTIEPMFYSKILHQLSSDIIINTKAMKNVNILFRTWFYFRGWRSVNDKFVTVSLPLASDYSDVHDK